MPVLGYRKPRPKIPCAYCGILFPVEDHVERRRYCTYACFEAHRVQQDTSQKGNVFCLVCGSEILDDSGYFSQVKNRKYCSHRCRAKDRTGIKRVTPPLAENRLHRIWEGMINRCMRTNDKDYQRYGGRGIVVCLDWLEDFRAFEAWANSHGYSSGLQIDRKNNNQGYSPENCKFSTPKEQARNRRSSTFLTAFGETKTAVEWSEDPRCEVAYQTLIARVSRQGVPHLSAITTPSRPFGQRHLKIT